MFSHSSQSGEIRAFFIEKTQLSWYTVELNSMSYVLLIVGMLLVI